MTDSSPATTLLDILLLPATLCFVIGAALAGLHPASRPFVHHRYGLIALAVVLVCTGMLFSGLKKFPNLKTWPWTDHTDQTTSNHINRRDKALWIRLVLLLLFFALVGFIHTWTALQPPSDPSHIYNLIRKKTKVTLEGKVTGMATISGDKSSFVLALSHILFREEPDPAPMRPATGKVRLAMRGNAPDFIRPGQKLLVVASIDRIHNYQTPGTFDYVLYMRNKGIFCSGWIKSPHHIMARPTASREGIIDIRLPAQRFRQRIDNFLRQHCDPVTGGLYRALLIGNRSGLSRDTSDHFAASGCMHLLAISGLHMGLLAFLLHGMVYWLLKRCQWLLMHTNASALALCLTFPFLFGYAFIAGMNAPVFRALIMAGFFLLAVVCNRQHQLFHLLAAAALVLLALHPLALFTASFQLSFAALIAIALITPSLHTLHRRQQSDNKGIITKVILWPLTAFLISLAATAGTLPLLLYHFNRFSPIGPLMNLVIEPLLCFIALPLGLLAAPFVTVAPKVAIFLFSCGGYALRAADILTTKTAQLPLASIWTITPASGEIATYYLLIFLFWKIPRQTIKYRLFIAGSAILLLFHFTAGLYLPKIVHVHQGKKARVSFLDVGKGSSTLLELTDGTTILIDGGGSSSDRFNVGRQIIAPFLWKQRIWRLNALVITHPDQDHYNGLGFIVRRFYPQIAYINDQPIQAPGYAALITTIQQQQIRLTTPRSGQTLHADSLCRLSCIGMTGLADENDSDNNRSLVMKLDCGKKSFLFPGDIEQRAEGILLENNRQIQADVLLTPHHGSRTSCSHPFLRTVAPQVIVVSAGSRQQNLFPAPWNRRWWQQKHIPFLITGIDGTIVCTTNGKQLATMSWKHETGWESREFSEKK